jgi:hypothetical protein
MSEQVERLKAFEYAAKPALDDGETLRDEDVDLETGVVRVERSWDPKQGPIEPKSRAGRRVVPIVASLRSHLAARTLWRGGAEGLFFEEGRPALRRRRSTRPRPQGMTPCRGDADRLS